MLPCYRGIILASFAVAAASRAHFSKFNRHRAVGSFSGFLKPLQSGLIDLVFVGAGSRAQLTCLLSAAVVPWWISPSLACHRHCCASGPPYWFSSPSPCRQNFLFVVTFARRYYSSSVVRSLSFRGHLSLVCSMSRLGHVFLRVYDSGNRWAAVLLNPSLLLPYHSYCTGSQKILPRVGVEY